MIRSRTLLAALFALAAVALAGTAQPPAAAPNAPADGLTPAQKRSRELFQKFQRELLTLAQKLKASDKPEERDRADVLFAALELAKKERVEDQLQKMLEQMSKGVQPAELQVLGSQDQQVTQALREILQLLLSDDADTQRKQEVARLEKLLAELKDIIRQQQANRATVEAKQSDPKQVAAEQERIAERTKDLARKLDPAKAKESKDAKGPKDGAKPKDKDGKPGDPKDGKPSAPKDGKPGDPKDAKPVDPKEGKPSDAKPGDPKDGKAPEASPPSDSSKPSPPGQKPVSQAVPKQKQAAQEMQKPNRAEAAKNADEAIKKLKEAQDEIEKRLKQLRQEEQEKALKNLEERVKRMLAMQLEVLDATRAIDSAIVKAGGAKTNAEDQKSQQQADQEGKIAVEAEQALALLAAEGSAVAFAGILAEVRLDMLAVQRRLNDTFVGRDTQAVEENIVAMLKEMAEALKKAQQEQQQARQQQSQPGAAQKPPDQALLAAISELKLIKSLQLQLNSRTKLAGERYKGEAASDPIIQAELGQLSARQMKLEEMVRAISTGANR